MSRPVFAVDWDGTVVRSAWPEHTQEFMPGAIQALKQMLTEGSVLVFSCRLRIGEDVIHGRSVARTKAEQMMEAQYIRDTLDQAGLFGVDIWLEHGKPWADYYIDDKAVHYTGSKRGWDVVLEKVLKEDVFADL